MPQQTTWETYRKDVLGTPKFLRKGTKVLVKPTPPRKVKVEGRYGDRDMFIIETVDYGLIYISQLQLVQIADSFNGKYESAVTVEL